MLDDQGEEDKTEAEEVPAVPIEVSVDEEDREDMPELTKPSDTSVIEEISDFDGIEVIRGNKK